MAVSRVSGKLRLPSYSLHKATGQARVYVAGKDHYLGQFGSEESRRRYGELIAKLIAGVHLDPFAAQGEDDPGPTLAELTLAYQRHAEGYYVKHGQQTDEVACIKSVLKIVRELYGMQPAAEFGPNCLKAVRAKMVDSGKCCRKYINSQVSRIRRMFRWGVENELVEPAVLQKLEAVAPLLAGRTKAKDHTPRSAVAQATIEAVKAKISKERTRDMIDLMCLCGCRPGELVGLRGRMIDRSGDVWLANLDDHKTQHHGRQRIIPFSKKAQEILKRYLTLDPDRRLFPIARQTLSNAIKKACDQLGIKRFTAHWLRHTAATSIREQYGLDIAQAVLGHAKADMTQHYAHLEQEKLLQFARDAG